MRHWGMLQDGANEPKWQKRFQVSKKLGGYKWSICCEKDREHT
jgi:hypothetical protein